MSAYEQPGFSFSLVAGEALPQFRFVKVHTDGTALFADNGERGIGVVQNSPAVGEAATIVNSGIVFVEAGDTVTVGADVASDADGKAIVSATADLILGVALTGGADGEYVSVLLSAGPAATPA